MSEEKCDAKKLCEKLSEVLNKLSGVDVDKNTDRLIDAVTEYADATEKFTQRLNEVDKPFKSLINLGIIIDVSFAGDSKICVMGGGRKHLKSVLSNLMERLEK